MDITELTALEVAAAIRNGELTALEAAEAALDEINRQDGELNAFITVCGESALEMAKQADRAIKAGEIASPLAGVPVAVKDNICTKGIKTTCASKMLADYIPPYDAFAVERLKKAGCVIIGKTNMDEFGMGGSSEKSYFGAVRNPLDPKRSAGGSSGGSAAAVASGEAPAALGSDTGGSVRQPAARCGIAGFKPTYGAVSRYGLIAYASSLDQIGTMAKDVRDCAALFDVIRGNDPRDATSAAGGYGPCLPTINGDVRGVRIAVPREDILRAASPSAAEAVFRAEGILKDLGAVTEDISLPYPELYVPAYYVIASCEASSNLARYDGVRYGFRTDDFDGMSGLYRKTRSEGFGAEVKKRIMLGTFALSGGFYDEYYSRALKCRTLIKQGFDALFSEYDLILTPAATDTAPPLGEKPDDPNKPYLSDIFTIPANLAGLPSLSVPCGKDKNDIPAGVLITGKKSGDRDVLNTGLGIESGA